MIVGERDKVEIKKIAIIGGGVSGMAAAYYLSKAGQKVDLYEQCAELGGRIGLGSFNGDSVCFGGKNIGYEYQEFRDFLSHYGQPEYEYFGINSARLESGKPRVLNSKNKIRSLFTLSSAATIKDLWRFWRVLKHVKSDRRNGDINSPAVKGGKANKSPMLNDYFSETFLQKIIRPLTVRMNGAEPEKVSLENFGSHMQMLQDEYEQLNQSLALIFRALHEDDNITVHVNSAIEAVTKHGSLYTLHFAQDRQERYESIIMALPAPITAGLLENIYPSLSTLLERVQYFPVGVLMADYKNKVFTQEMRALVLGKTSTVSNIGAYSAQQLNRVRYTFSGEMAEEILHESLDEKQLLAQAEHYAAPYFNIKNNSCVAYQLKYWQVGLCAYTQDEADFQSKLDGLLIAVPGLYLTGDFKKGASIENCFRAAKVVIEQYLVDIKAH